MTAKLRISEGLALPIEAVTETFAILAKRGKGKTYTGSVLAEELLEVGMPVAIVDPVGVWWGLKSSADGRSAGYPIVIFGGEHADVPLEETAGLLIADVLVDERISAILDLALLNKSAARRFMLDFVSRLYHRNRQALHVIVDEADMFAPQSRQGSVPRSATTETLLGAMEDLVRRGRARGIGCTLITQRPAVLHKDVLSQAEVLVALGMSGKHDVDAIDDWVRLHADPEQARELKASLPSLPTGTAWVWSPGWLGILQRVEIRRRRTFDSSATPKPGEVRRTPTRTAAIDLTALGERIATTVERAKADDPRELRRQVAERDQKIAKIERELKTAQDATPEPVEIQVPVLRASMAERLERWAVEMHGIANQVELAAHTVAERVAAVQRPSAPALAPPSPPRRTTATRPAAPPPRAATTPTDGDRPPLKAGARKMLATLARHHPMRMTRAQLGTLSGLKHTGGTYGTYYSTLRRGGYLDEAAAGIGITQAGLDYLGIDVGEPLTTEEVIDQWRAALKAGARTMLDELVAAYPDSIGRSELGDRVGITPSGGTFGTYLSTLRRNGLIEQNGDQVRAAEVLFLAPPARR